MKLRREFTILGGLVLIAVGALRLYASWPGGGVRLAYDVGLIAVGVVFVGFAVVIGRLTKPAGRRAAGSVCAGCQRKILFEHEALFCEECDRALHARCLDDHRARTHKPDPTQPFR